MTRRRRVLPITAAASVAVHIAAALLVVFLPRVLPKEASPPEQGTVELLMVERTGVEPSAAAQPRESQPTPPTPEKRAKIRPSETQKSETPATASPPVAENGDEKVPTQAKQLPSEEARMADKQGAHKPTAKSVPPKAPDALVFDLAGTESQSNADVLGGHVVPAGPDNRFRNRPPIYPREAALHGEHGAVLLVIHVSEGGFATGADVVESSGVASLDQAATDAVLKWHFRPALREGRAVPFNMPFRFVFEAN
jgi:periplasmic protein TonB